MKSPPDIDSSDVEQHVASAIFYADTPDEYRAAAIAANTSP